ncbi:hypothetical protein BCR43DRAFT_493534, partial [Syncephalastrum racemosum]
MTPDQIVVQLKRKGTFDELRKALLSDFMNNEAGQALRQKVEATMQELVDKNPSLLDKDRSGFHATVMKELESAGIYGSLRVETLLREKRYQDRMEEEIRIELEKSAANNDVPHSPSAPPSSTT